MSVIWVTRGESWGFRFLHDGGIPNALEIYESVFEGSEGLPSVFQTRYDTIAIRFADPLGRKDRSGRPIPHDFVVSGEDAEKLTSFDVARAVLWKRVKAEYEVLWNQP